MRVLITSSRMPFALDEIRRFGEAGHEVFATDTFPAAPGSHSTYVEESRVTASPRYGAGRFVAEIEAFVRDREIDKLLPAFEEVFYLAKERERFDPITELFAPSFETLVRLHDKTQFVELARDLGLAVPDTTVAKNRDELREAVAEYDKYFARPAYSRGGITLVTNHGPLAGAIDLEDCDPTEDNPFLVQEFVEGLDVCSFSVVQHGKIAAHSTYVHPKTIEHAGGIVFESVDEPQTLEITRKFVEATDYHGQISIDFMKTDRGLLLVECNPRPTAGVTVMPSQMFVDAVCNPAPDQPPVAPAGVRVKTGVALLRDMIVNWREIPADIAELLSDSRDVYAQSGDLVPMLYSFLSLGRVAQYRKQLGTGRHKRSDLMASYFYDICWDGEVI